MAYYEWYGAAEWSKCPTGWRIAVRNEYYKILDHLFDGPEGENILTDPKFFNFSKEDLIYSIQSFYGMARFYAIEIDGNGDGWMVIDSQLGW